MTNAAKPRSIRSGDIHHRSVRSVRCWMWARAGEKTPDAERFAVGALIYCDPLRVASSESTHSERRAVPRGARSRTTVSADTFVVDIAPEFGVVLGVGDRDFLSRLVQGVPGQIQLAGVDVEQLNVVD